MFSYCRFNESLKDAVTLNTAGTKRVIKLCQEMRKLKVSSKQVSLFLINEESYKYC